VLTIGTNYSDSDSKVEWKNVTVISSVRKFNIYLSSREKIFTALSASGNAGFAILSDGAGNREVKLDEILIIDPIHDTSKDRFNASISAGFTVTKANNSKQFTSRATASYHTRNWNLRSN